RHLDRPAERGQRTGRRGGQAIPGHRRRGCRGYPHRGTAHTRRRAARTRALRRSGQPLPRGDPQRSDPLPADRRAARARGPGRGGGPGTRLLPARPAGARPGRCRTDIGRALMSSTVIRAGTVVTGDGRTVTPATDVVIADGRIRDLLPANPDLAYDRVDRSLDASGKLVLPGVINNHSHGTAFGPLFPSGHQGLPAEQVLATLDRHLREGTTTLLCVDGFVTAEQLAATRAQHPINIGLACCNTPASLRAAEICDGGGLADSNRELTATAAARECAVPF